MKTKRYAAIDIGSNAIRLLIYNIIDFEGKKIYKKQDLIRVPVRMGTEAFKNELISENNIQKFIHTMKAFANLMEAYQVSQFRACATSALREAKNSEEIVARVRKETGIQIDIITGEEEAAIIHSAHQEKFYSSPNSFLYVDVGGGSVELSLFEKGINLETKSFKIGTLRFLNNVMYKSLWTQLETWIKTVTANKRIILIGSGGNINKVFKISKKSKNDSLTKIYLENYLEELKQYTFEERILKLDLHPERADVIIPALTIFTSIMEWSNSTEIYVPKMGLADGLIKMMD